VNKQASIIVGIGLLLIVAVGITYYWSASREAPATSSLDMAEAVRAGPFRVAVTIEPEAPTAGQNSLRVVLADAEGRPVEDAQVRATATMAAMGAMPEMRAPATMTERTPGVYEGTLTLSMDGSWPLTLDIEKAGVGNARLMFGLATRRRGLELISGGEEPTGRSTASSDTATAAGTIQIDSRRRQAIGVTTDEAEVIAMRRTIRGVGRVAYDDTRLTDVSLRFDGWIGELNAEYVGARVEQGETLFTVYGPQLFAAQQEYVELARRTASGPILEAARKRLELWHLGDAEIEALERRGVPADYVPITAPRSGVVVVKNVVEGSAAPAGETLLRIADLGWVWIEADVYESDFELVTVGMPATVTLPYVPGERFAGTVEYVYPFVDGETRTGRVRLALENPDGVLKPEMYADVSLEADLGRHLAVPEEAVLVSGDARIAFVDLGEGRLEPRRVEVGARAGGYVQILDGLASGDVVVTSANFLIAAEASLAGALEQW